MCQGRIYTTTVKKMDPRMTVSRTWPLSLIMATLIVLLQFSYNPIMASAVNINSSVATDITTSSNLVITNVAPSSNVSSDSSDMGSSTVTQWTTEETPVTTTTERSPVYSSLREKDANQPESCANFKIHDEQPHFNSSTWFKCCPEGQVLSYNKTCYPAVGILPKFNPPLINATFFKDCIEDSESFKFPIERKIYIPQDQSMLYDEEQLYILQNGSLLVVFDNVADGYSIYTDYCLDVDQKTHSFFALVWTPEAQQQIRTGVVLSKFYKGIAFIMTFSFCCLLFTSALYLIIPRFGTLHGRSFALHALNLALGYVFTASMYFKWDGHSRMEGNGFLHYFVSAAFMWQFTMCVDTLINVWYYIPKNISPIEGQFRGWIHFAIYVVFSQSIPFLFLIASTGEDSSSVSYYMSTLDDENHDDQWRFFGPILAIILLCIGMFGGIYYGFRKLNSIQSFAYIIRMKLRKQKREDIPMPFCTKEMEYVKDSARSTCFLFAIQSLCFISEMITFYTTNSSSIFFELMNAMQGVFILILFVMLPKPLKIIRQCWAGDQGSLVVEQPHKLLRKEEVPLNQMEKA